MSIMLKTFLNNLRTFQRYPSEWTMPVLSIRGRYQSGWMAVVHYKNMSSKSQQLKSSPSEALPPEVLALTDDIPEPQLLDEPKYSRAKRLYITNTLTQSYRFTAIEAASITSQDQRMKKVTEKHLLDTVEFLRSKNIKKEAVLRNPWILAIQPSMMSTKFSILEQMNPRDIHHFLPLLRASTVRLMKILKNYKRESAYIPERHRIYFLSKRLQVEPEIVANHLSTHLFMFDILYENLVENLRILLEYKVAPINILRDPWAFKYMPKSIRSRLERARLAQKDKLMPWMVRCTEPILEKSLQHSVEEKKLLGDETVLEFLSKRLGYNLEETKYIVRRHPAVVKVRVTKINEILDFLLNEAGFTTHHIAMVPRIMCHSLETTKHRLAELKSYGCEPSTLVIVCRSRREYQKFLTNWIETRAKLQNAGILGKQLDESSASSSDEDDLRFR